MVILGSDPVVAITFTESVFLDEANRSYMADSFTNIALNHSEIRLYLIRSAELVVPLLVNITSAEYNNPYNK